MLCKREQNRYKPPRMPNHRLVAALLLCTPGALAQSSSTLQPVEIKLTDASVRRLLQTLPELTRITSEHQAQFVSSMSGAGPAPELTEADAAKVNAVFQKNGFTMEEFAMQVSALLATYLTLQPGAFEKQLPSFDKPEVQAVLNDPKVSKEHKDMVRAQVEFAQANKDAIRKQFAELATENNRRIVKPVLADVKKVFEDAEALARKALASNPRGPRKN